MESRSWLPLAASHGGLLRGKGTQGGVKTPKWAGGGLGGGTGCLSIVLGCCRVGGEGMGAGGPHRVCSSQATPGFGAFSKGHGHSGAGACHQKGPHPRSIPSPQHHPRCLFQTHPLLPYSLPPGILYNGGFVPCVTSGFLPLTVQLPGRQNQFGKHTQSLKTHWDQCHRSSGGTRQEATPMSPSPGFTCASRRGRR